MIDMLSNEPNKANLKTPRRPLYDSVWLALFELLRRELSQVGSSTLSRGDTFSPRP
jgi:hypothetical protein